MAKDPAAVKLGRKGGKARAAKQSAEQLSDIGKRGADSRWGNATEKERKAVGEKLAAARAKGKKKVAVKKESGRKKGNGPNKLFL